MFLLGNAKEKNPHPKPDPESPESTHKITFNQIQKSIFYALKSKFSNKTIISSEVEKSLQLQLQIRIQFQLPTSS